MRGCIRSGAPFVLGALLFAAPTAARAENASDADEIAPNFVAHGFVSQGAILSTGNNYLAKSKRGSLEFSDLGVNFTSQPTDRLRIGLQLFSRDLGPTGNYSTKADWYYLDYRLRDWFGIRAGRVKVPLGFFNDNSDVDAAHVPILLPQSIYPIADRDFLLAQTGVEVYGYVDLRRGGALEYRAYAGTIYLPLASLPGASEIDVPYLVGGRVIWETPAPGLRIAASGQALRLNVKLPLPGTGTMPMATPAALGFDVQIGVASIEYVHRDLTLVGELSEWRVDLDAATVALSPTSKKVTVSERAYLLGHYHVNRWFWPGAYYSVLFPDEAKATFTGASQDMQHDVAGTLRFDINARWLVKLEGHWMHGTADVDRALNGNAMLGTLTRDWAVFLAKTTAYF
jgi:hypothetical protein